MADHSRLFRRSDTAASCCAVLALTLLGQPLLAQSDETALLRACTAQVAAKFRQWRYAPVTEEVAEWARSNDESPTVTYGDFDGDGRQDVALLVQDGPAPAPEYPARMESLHIAVCLNPPAGMRLYLIDKPYCGDGITLRLKGEPYHDFETETEDFYQLDGVHAYCFEKAGATYVFENGDFRLIVDSD